MLLSVQRLPGLIKKELRYLSTILLFTRRVIELISQPIFDVGAYFVQQAVLRAVSNSQKIVLDRSGCAEFALRKEV